MRANQINPIIAIEGSSCGRQKNLRALDALKLRTGQASDYPTLLDTLLKKLEDAEPGYTTTNVIPLCIDIKCYDFVEKLLVRKHKNHSFQVFFPVNDPFHIYKTYAESVFENYHALFFHPICAAIFPASQTKGVFQNIQLSQVTLYMCLMK